MQKMVAVLRSERLKSKCLKWLVGFFVALFLLFLLVVVLVVIVKRKPGLSTTIKTTLKSKIPESIACKLPSIVRKSYD